MVFLFQAKVFRAVATSEARHPCPRRTPRSRPCPSRHVTSCMFIAAVSVSRARLLSTRSCSTTPASSCVRAWRCRSADQDGTADLVEHAVALCSFDGSITARSDAVDRIKLSPAAEVPHLSCIIRPGDRRGIRHIHGRKPCLKGPPCDGREVGLGAVVLRSRAV